ncbi:DUF6515 family protein [Psychroserpens mesophilus]|uniref:DUF6515 family protein n=1 Tax=Psychroserpens mesophilus TaxID=325473 RepID=UPI0006931CCF|nr:DUF6515 family protein [Psychroserpens mesophilus]
MKTCIIFLLAIGLLSFNSCARRVVVAPSTVTVVKPAPKNYKIVKVKNKRYYFWNGKHYKKTRKGYIVVKV